MTQTNQAVNSDIQSPSIKEIDLKGSKYTSSQAVPIKTVTLMGTRYISSTALSEILLLPADDVKKAMAKVTGLRSSPGDAAILTIGDHSNLAVEVYCNAAGFVAASPFLMSSNDDDTPRGWIKEQMSLILNQLLKLEGEYTPDFDSEDHNGAVSPLQVMALKNALNEGWLSSEEENSKALALRLAEALHDLNVSEGIRNTAMLKVTKLQNRVEELEAQLQEVA